MQSGARPRSGRMGDAVGKSETGELDFSLCGYVHDLVLSRPPRLQEMTPSARASAPIMHAYPHMQRSLRRRSWASREERKK